MGRAKLSALEAAQGLLLETLVEEVMAYRRGEVRNAKGDRMRVPASLLGELSKLLKISGVDRPDHDAPEEDLLADELDEFEQDNVLPFAGWEPKDVSKMIEENVPGETSVVHGEDDNHRVEQQSRQAHPGEAYCSDCGTWSPLEAFNKHSSRPPDYVQPFCRKHQNQRKKAARERARLKT